MVLHFIRFTKVWDKSAPVFARTLTFFYTFVHFIVSFANDLDTVKRFQITVAMAEYGRDTLLFIILSRALDFVRVSLINHI